MMRKSMILAAALVLAACATSANPYDRLDVAVCVANPDTEADFAWLDRALEAWRFARREIAAINVPANTQAVFFDADCAFTSPNALTARSTREITWSGDAVNETVTLPSGDQIPVGVISFARAENGRAYFVMSMPSVWRAGGVDNPGIGLETMMVAVLLHEASHVSQGTTYGARMSALAEANHLPESFDDDAIQRRFQTDTDFAGSVQRETDLFFQAAAAADNATALRLAREARGLMKARAARYFTGADAYLSEAEDIWLTMEGSGQYLGYRWVIDPRGGAQSVDVALPNFARRSRWWSQNEGLGVFLALDRIAGHGWQRPVYGDGAHTVLQLLDAAL